MLCILECLFLRIMNYAADECIKNKNNSFEWFVVIFNKKKKCNYLATTMEDILFFVRKSAYHG